MFNSDYKDEAKKKLEKNIKLYNEEYTKLISKIENLYKVKNYAFNEVKNIEKYLDKNANLSDNYRTDIIDIKNNIRIFAIENEKIASECKAYQNNSDGAGIGTAAIAGAGVATGAIVGGLGATTAMAVATTFGAASTGAAISGLTGIAATNAALAWIGGGALVAGGGGMVAGEAALALLGPIGWAIGGVALIGTGIFASSKNREAGEDAEKKSSIIKKELIKLEKNQENINSLTNLLNNLITRVQRRYTKALSSTTDVDLRLEFKMLINRTKRLTETINKKLEMIE